jgi:hypothetical protein
MIHSRAELAKIGEADAEFQQFRKFKRRVLARRYADLVDRAPEAITGMRIVMAEISGALASGSTDEDEAEMVLELVGEFFQRVSTFGYEDFLMIDAQLPQYRPLIIDR